MEMATAVSIRPLYCHEESSLELTFEDAILRAELQTMPLALYDDAIRGLSDMTPDEGLATSIKRLNFRYLLASRTALENPAPWYPYLQPRFLASPADTAYEDERVVVYRLR